VLEISVAKNFSCSVEQKVLKKFAQRWKSIAQKSELSEKNNVDLYIINLKLVTITVSTVPISC